MKYFLTGLIALFSLPLFSQKFTQEVAIGGNVGATLSSVRFNPTIHQTTYQQQVIGFTTRYISEKYWGLQMEINYSQRGWKEENPDIPLHKYTRSLGYLEIPAYTHLYFEGSKYFRILFNAGPQVGFLLHEDTKENEVHLQTGAPRPTSYDTNVQKAFDYGICGGGGFELRTKAGIFTLEGRYYFGLSDIYNNSKSDFFSASANQVVSVKLTYLIPMLKF